MRNIIWAEDRDYKTGSEDEPIQFYLDSLCNSNKFDLLLGYFSSTALNVLALGFANFIYSGGRMRIIINNFLSHEDKQAIEKGQSKTEILDFSSFSALHNALDEYGIHFFECLAWMIANEKIDIKIIRPKDKKGIAHYKSGIFSDGKDTVGFKSSCNFTAYGLLENLEELECFLSWDDSRSNKFINKQTKYFNEIFNEEALFVEYLDIKDVREEIIENFGSKSLYDLLHQEIDLLEKKTAAYKNVKIQRSIAAAKSLNEINKRLEMLPKFPYLEGPRQYQIDAYKNWIENNKKGLFNMATGTGKTLTSLNCLLEQHRESNYYKAIILVPTRALVEQWKTECRKFNFTNIITVSTKEKWPENISFLNSASNFIEVSFVIIVTYATFYRKNFQSHFKDLPADTLFIADEAHNLGSSNVSKLFPKIHLNNRIGLSATPDRQFDTIGNQNIEVFFNDKAPYVYNFTMEQAMKLGWLCQYKYYPHVIKLTPTELFEYIKKSKQLIKYFDASTKRYKDCKEVEILLLERKRIIHKAFNKLEKFQEIIRREFENKGTLKYSLVYVPEGIEPNYEQYDSQEEESEDIKLINIFTKAISQTDPSIMVKQFTSNTVDRDSVIKSFQNGAIDVLTSIKCLDEGVDVPRTELAIFCSSTGNPRQFIQRRGRVLRTHKEKTFAIIHDLIVVPETGDESTFELERSMVKKELERVVDFSNLSMNKIDTYNELKDTLTYYKISLSNIKNE